MIVLLALAVAGTLHAQQGVPLSLDEALRLAREGNPAYRRALADMRAADAEEQRGWGAFLPSLNTRLSFGGFDARAITGQDDFGEPVRLPDPVEYRGSSASQGLDLSLRLFDGGETLQRFRAARAAADAVSAALDAEVARLHAEVARRYYDVLRADRLVALERRLLESARAQHEATQRLFRVAAVNRVDVLGAEIDLAAQDQALERARGEARKARLALREVLGTPDDAEYELTDEAPPVFDPATLNADELVASAQRASPRVLEQEARARFAERSAGAARAARWPTISANAYLSRGVSLASYDALFELNPRNRTLGFGVSATLPLFTQFRATAAIAQADAARERAREDVRAGRLAVGREVRSALIDLQNAHRTVLLAERSAELSRERVELAGEQYRVGAITYTALQQVLERAAAAEREQVNAQFAFPAARLTLEEKVGLEVRP